MTDSYRFKINEYSHKLLHVMFLKFSPIMRRSGEWDDSGKILESELYSTAAFVNFSIQDLNKELDISEVFLQDVCEYLEMQRHIEVTQILNSSVIEKIRATKLGFHAYKFESYLAKNDTLIYQNRFRKSALLNNILTPIVALMTLITSAVTLYTQSKQTTEAQVKQQQFQQTIQTIDSSRRVETNALFLNLSRNEKSLKEIKDSTKSK